MRYALSTAIAVTTACALLFAGSASAQTANANANAGASSSSGSFSSSGSNGNSINIQSGKSYRGTGAAFAPSLAVGGFSCQGSVSGGAGGAGWGFSFGSTVMDRDCNTRENAKIAAQAFGIGVGRKVLCNIKQISDAAGGACGNAYAAVSDGRRPPRRGYVYGYQATPVRALFQNTASATPGAPKKLTANQIGAKQAAARLQAKWAAMKIASN
jgi:hypothetical protein